MTTKTNSVCLSYGEWNWNAASCQNRTRKNRCNNSRGQTGVNTVAHSNSNGGKKKKKKQSTSKKSHSDTIQYKQSRERPKPATEKLPETSATTSSRARDSRSDEARTRSPISASLLPGSPPSSSVCVCCSPIQRWWWLRWIEPPPLGTRGRDAPLGFIPYSATPPSQRWRHLRWQISSKISLRLHAGMGKRKKNIFLSLSVHLRSASRPGASASHLTTASHRHVRASVAEAPFTLPAPAHHFWLWLLSAISPACCTLGMAGERRDFPAAGA